MKSVVRIGCDAFSGCFELTDISLADGVERIYRAGSLERSDGNQAAVLWIPLADIPFPNGLSFRVYVESESGLVRGSETFIQK